MVDYVKKILAQDRVRIIGVCYGHQIVGRALGGEVQRSDGVDGGWEVSVCTVNLTEKGKELFGKEELVCLPPTTSPFTSTNAPPPSPQHIHQMHKDILPHLPPIPTTLLGTSPRCTIQGLYIPARVLTVQGHPEFTEEIVRELLEARRAQGIFGEEVFREAMGRVGEGTDGVGVGGGFLRFLRG